MRKPVAILFAVLLAVQGWAISITNIASGSWTNTAVWNPAQIPTFDDSAVITGYTITVHDQPINVGTLTHSAGTLTFTGGSHVISNGWYYTGGVENLSNSAITVANGMVHMVLTKNVGSSTVYLTGNNTISNAANIVSFYNVNLAYSNNTISHLGGQFANEYITGSFNLKGGTLTNTTTTGWITIYSSATNAPISALPGSRIILSQSNFNVALSNSFDASSFFSNTTFTNSGNYYRAVVFSALARSNITVSILNVTNTEFKGGIGLSRNSSTPNLIISNSSFASPGFFVYTSDTPYTSNQVVKILSSTLGVTNVTGASTSWSLGASTNSTLSVIDSTINAYVLTYPFLMGTPTTTHYITNSTFAFLNQTYSSPTVSGAFMTSNSTAIYYNYGGLNPYDVGNCGDPSAWNYLTLSTNYYPSNPFRLAAATTVGTLSNNGTLNCNGFTLGSQDLINRGRVLGSNSTILVDNSFINSGGVFSQMTSTVQFGASTNTASSNITNFYSLVCNTPGKTVALTNGLSTALVLDASRNNLNATNKNAAAPVSGIRDGALSFNGSNQYVQLPTVLTSFSNFTISMFVKMTDTSFVNSSYAQTPISLYFGTSDIRIANDVASGGGLALSIDIAGSTFNRKTVAAVFTNNTWVHFAVTFSTVNTNIATYKNGTIVSNSTGVFLGVLAWNVLGARADTQGFFQGALDDVRIYNRTLASNEVVNIYNGNAPTNGLVAYWPLNDIGTIPINGTFSSRGTAASNVTWTSSSITLSNRAYLYFTSPNLYFSGGQAAEIWDASGGTNKPGNADYFPR